MTPCIATRERYNGRKPRGPVCRNTSSTAFAAPIEKRGFVMPKFWGVVRQRVPFPTVTGEMGLSARTSARLLTCYEHLVHLMPVVRLPVVLLSPTGAKTMSAPVTAGRRAAPKSPASGTSAIQLHADAHNALAMAAYYLRQPQVNVPAARRKAVQALAALRGLSDAVEV